GLLVGEADQPVRGPVPATAAALIRDSHPLSGVDRTPAWLGEWDPEIALDPGDTRPSPVGFYKMRRELSMCFQERSTRIHRERFSLSASGSWSRHACCSIP